MADPGPVAQSFWVDENVRKLYELDGIVTLVDSKHVNHHLDEKTDEVMAQVAFADRVILNKIDLVEEGELTSLKNRLQTVNQMAGFYSAKMAEAPIQELLDIGGFNLDRALDMKPNFLEPEYPFEWGGIYALPAGDYQFQLANGPDPDMAFLLVELDQESEDSEAKVMELAEQVFIAFSEEEAPLADGQSITKPGQCYRMQLEGQTSYTFNFSSDGTKKIAVFSQHTPEEFEMKLLDASKANYEATAQHYFNAGHEHDDTVSSVAVEFKGVFDTAKIDTWLNMFIKTQGENIYRMKGVIGLKDEDSRYIIQGVHMIIGSLEGEPWGEEAPYSRLIFIGKNLDEDYIQGALEACLH